MEKISDSYRIDVLDAGEVSAGHKYCENVEERSDFIKSVIIGRGERPLVLGRADDVALNTPYHPDIDIDSPGRPEISGLLYMLGEERFMVGGKFVSSVRPGVLYQHFSSELPEASLNGHNPERRLKKLRMREPVRLYPGEELNFNDEVVIAVSEVSE